MNFKNILLLTIILSLFSSNLFSQNKYEREYKIKEQDVPNKAIKFIDNSFKDSKIKWFLEHSLDGKTFEAKTKLNKYKFSVEFDTIGNVLDVEKTMQFEKLDAVVKESINKSLQNKFTSYKIIKTQIQWEASNSTLHELISNNNSTNTYSLSYELILKAKKDEVSNFYEVLLDRSGTIIDVFKITERNTDNLNF